MEPYSPTGIVKGISFLLHLRNGKKYPPGSGKKKSIYFTVPRSGLSAISFAPPKKQLKRAIFFVLLFSFGTSHLYLVYFLLMLTIMSIFVYFF